MITLTSTLESLRVTTSAAVALDVHATYIDNTTTTFVPGRSIAAITTATTTTVVAAPAASTQRGVKHLSASARGGANVVTVDIFDGTTSILLFSVSLALGELLEYEDGQGWRVFGSDGAAKSVIAPAFTSVQSLGWNTSTTPTLSLPILAAGHAPGIYLVSRSFVQTTVSVVGTLNPTLTWRSLGASGAAQTPATPMVYGHTNPGTAVTTMWKVVISTSAGIGWNQPSPPLAIASDGSQAIVLELSHASAVATFDVFASAMRIG